MLHFPFAYWVPPPPSSGSLTITTPGAGTWTVLATSVTLEWWGTGGCGGASNLSGAGDGGGGGGYGSITLTGLTIGSTISYNIGATPTPPASGNTPVHGNDTTITVGATTYTGQGGRGGRGCGVGWSGTTSDGGTSTNGSINLTGTKGDEYGTSPGRDGGDGGDSGDGNAGGLGAIGSSGGGTGISPGGGGGGSSGNLPFPFGGGGTPGGGQVRFTW